MPSPIIPFLRCPFCATDFAIACKEVDEYSRRHRSNGRLFAVQGGRTQSLLLSQNGTEFPCEHVAYLWGDIRSVFDGWELNIDWRNDLWSPPSVDTPGEELFWDLLAVNRLSRLEGVCQLPSVRRQWWCGRRQFEIRVSGVCAEDVGQFLVNLDSRAQDDVYRRAIESEAG